MERQIIFLISILIFTYTRLFAQQISPESLNSGGESFQNANNGIGFIIGELVVTSMKNDTIAMGHGFNQINEPITTVNSIITPTRDIIIFPNPTSQQLYIQIDMDNLSDIKFELYDIGGKTIIKTEHIITDFTKVDLTPFSNGNYILKIYEDKITIASYKVQKINY